jgi:hypothetical protein
MSFARRLLDLFTGGSTARFRETHVRIVEHRSSTEVVVNVARALNIPADEVERMLRQESGRELLVELAARAGTVETPITDPAHLPARRVECSGCHRTVARGRGICVYCGTDLPLASGTTSQAPTLQQSVDGQFIQQQSQQPPEATKEEQLAFLRRLSHM